MCTPNSCTSVLTTQCKLAVLYNTPLTPVAQTYQESLLLCRLVSLELTALLPITRLASSASLSFFSAAVSARTLPVLGGLPPVALPLRRGDVVSNAAPLPLVAELLRGDTSVLRAAALLPAEPLRGDSSLAVAVVAVLVTPAPVAVLSVVAAAVGGATRRSRLARP